MTEFKMPKLGADMTAGTLIEWLKKPGDLVSRGDIIAEVDTDKGVIEVEVFVDGKIEKLLVKTGDEVPVGTTLAIINENGEEVAKTDNTTRTIKTETEYGQKRLRVSPSARKLAEKLGINLESVKGSGQGGRIQRNDIELAAQKKQTKKRGKTDSARNNSEKEKSGAESFTRMRQAIAASMTRSKREIPHYYLGTSIDINRSLEWLAGQNSERSVKDRILYSVLLLKAVALALLEVPEFNAVWKDDELIINKKINVGTAISLRQGGLIAPALHNTDKQSLDDLMKNLRDLVNRTRTGALRSSELSDSTITVTSLGENSVETVFGVIYPPQVALVGFGKIYEDVTVIEGRIKGTFKINASLSADHRGSDGYRGAIFLNKIDKFLQNPEKL
jgi:pyruvate dehydrogenase E2 component (dihydrolipoamide acetyltransferase)